MTRYTALASLPLTIDAWHLEPLEAQTASGWTRLTTMVCLEGGGLAGRGEDVTYSSPEQQAFRRHGPALPMGGRYTLEGFSRHLDNLEIFPREPAQPASRLYRRWAFESAALDLALQQAGTSLAAALGITPQAVRYVVSTGLGSPPSVKVLEDRLALYPNLRFKVDLSPAWTPQLVQALAATGRIDTVDLKGLYHGAFTGPPADPVAYRLVAEGIPDAVIEDPALNPETAPVLSPHHDRVAWDANIHSLADVEMLPFRPRHLNIKPSRFGRLTELLRTYAYCQANGIAMYGGGQFELGCGRGHIQYLASLFHPDAPNDVAPSAFNAAPLAADIPQSPLTPRPAATGFRWLAR